MRIYARLRRPPRPRDNTNCLLHHTTANLRATPPPAPDAFATTIVFSIPLSERCVRRCSVNPFTPTRPHIPRPRSRRRVASAAAAVVVTAAVVRNGDLHEMLGRELFVRRLLLPAHGGPQRVELPHVLGRRQILDLHRGALDEELVGGERDAALALLEALDQRPHRTGRDDELDGDGLPGREEAFGGLDEVAVGRVGLDLKGVGVHGGEVFDEHRSDADRVGGD